MFKLIYLNEIHNEKGNLHVGLTSKVLSRQEAIEEIYLNTVLSNCVKGWILHKYAICNLLCIKGHLTVYLQDKQLLNLQKVDLNFTSNVVLSINNNTWFAIKNYEKKSAQFLNCSTVLHNEDIILRREFVEN
jgi:hypothetical protein